MSTTTKGGFIKGKESITISYQGEVYTLPLGEQATKALQAIKEDRWEDIPNIVDTSKAVETYSEGNLQVKEGVVFVKGQPLPSNLSNRIIEFMEEEAPYQPLIRFWERLEKNPSYRAVNELYGFLEAANIPILDDGRVLTYKVVRKLDQPIYRNAGTYCYGNVSVVTKGGYAPYVDIYTGQVIQQIGDIVSMKRRHVDEDSSRTCSNGLECVASH